MRGSKNPLLVDLTSSIAELSGRVLSSLMPTWAKTLIPESRNKVKRVKILFMGKDFSVTVLKTNYIRVKA